MLFAAQPGSAMPDAASRLNAALSGRYRVERKLGAERFLAEIRTTAKLQHPHILPLHDSGEADGLLVSRWPTSLLCR
jgi:hypothetical protein